MYLLKLPTFLLLLFIKLSTVKSQENGIGKFEEVFAWKQLTYNFNGVLLQKDTDAEIDVTRQKRQSDYIFYNTQFKTEAIRNQRPVTSQTTIRPTDDESGRFFIRYNNVPMGVERVGSRVFVTVPRRRYGIPSTLNYIDLAAERNNRSPALKPYPSVQGAKTLTSVYRTRADSCGRLWMVDTGLLELPNNPQQLQPPAIVVFDLRTNEQILKYEFKAADIPADNTPTGLASITVDIIDNNCADTYAYIPDLTTFGIIVYSLRENDSWRLSHSYFHFNPTAGNLRISGQWFQWSDGIFSITLAGSSRCKIAYFHPLISTTEFSVSTCLLTNRTASEDPNYWENYNILGDRGENSQCTMHSYHEGSNVMFFADIGRDAVSCWNSGQSLRPSNVIVLARDSKRMSYPSDLHVTDDEVWFMANTLPRFGYSMLDTNEDNFFVYNQVENLNVADVESNTPSSDHLLLKKRFH
ncbi:hypothetical protein K1T71_000743 [Dendrolimus kikuchii]|uniref:Uncharacterized protein n=1 Tax=Dendrolimus kikuchii TaxID=765133 RepID=A0ACC1DK89_9NEOP|nr:hypothetical protein K1T71_000743 [Dendrolimus kikuchii]